MYIQRLIEFAEEHPEVFPPLGFKKQKIDWIVDIDDGDCIFNKANKNEMIVPTIGRSGSSITPILLVDKADYVFGWAPSDKERERSQIRHAAYTSLLEEYIAVAGDQDAQALLSVLKSDISFDEDLKVNDFIVFRIRGENYLHENKSVANFWSSFIQPEPDEKSYIIPCQFCGKVAPVMERHSIHFIINGERTKMISANENAYESHLNKNSYVAPTCFVCDQKYGQTLDYLLQKPPKTDAGDHMFSVGDLAYVYWLRGSSAQVNVANAMVMMHDANLKEMKGQLEQVFKGKKERSNFKDFCLLVLSPNKGRLVVREFIEESMGVIHERILQFLEAQYIGRDRLYSVFTLAGSVYQKPSTQMKKVDIQDWFNWVFQGRALPGRILIALMRRIQAEGAMYPSHAAVLKSWLVSQNEGREWTVKTDERNKSTEYVLGRLFAVLEKIQNDAIGSNETLGSRYLGAVSTTPKSVIGMLIKNAQYHLMKIATEKKGHAINLDKRLSKLLKMIDQIPTTLKLNEQAEFALGYYHEKEDLWSKREEK
ncbi:type I-C CRISPR-associated protein Cas8c/Csd1 [Bacillus niameyensis]|uniref:type I-C CRISPR-associated protein Cas8c/Csd1 n=1 Tax=Bacillus niameyensis TaxID=1522308 RepID=UPI000783197C|nr:type I-C CRISPR-associated protein Cas8c/Csd1 [Bacillus niameyensis]